MDPALTTDIMAPVMTCEQLRNCLVEIDADYQPIPELVVSWEPSQDAKVWVFKFSKGIEIHNGKTMDAKDVVYSPNHHRKKRSKSIISGLVKAIRDFKVDGKDTVMVTLESGNADFPFILSDSHMQIVPDGTTEYENGIGTAGYTLVS